MFTDAGHGTPTPTAPARLLVADDDRAIRESLQRVLSLEGYEVTTVADGAQALESARARPVDLMVLDLMMPAVDGLTVCRVLRAEGDRTPILMLTARTETSDRVGRSGRRRGRLPAQAVRPRRAARPGPGTAAARPTRAPTPGPPVLQVADLRLDPAARRAWRGDDELELSKTEFDLLEMLLFNQGIVLGRSRIYEEIWDYDFGPESKNLAVYISYLRRKVDDGHDTKLIHTVRGVGYTLRAD